MGNRIPLRTKPLPLFAHNSSDATQCTYSILFHFIHFFFIYITKHTHAIPDRKALRTGKVNRFQLEKDK